MTTSHGGQFYKFLQDVSTRWAWVMGEWLSVPTWKNFYVTLFECTLEDPKYAYISYPYDYILS